ncbi:MAG: response regulator transcription factor [Mariprofundaceae bacterium]|nr:response regulator transcription factor [Mariprofundaceae bacterium]
MNILIADDHPLFVEAIKIWLKQLDTQVNFNVAAKFDETIVRLQSEVRYDLVLLDLSMPGMEDIVEAVVYVCNQAYPTPVVIISSHEDPVVMRSCIKAGASGYLCKSLDGHAILNSLQSVLAGHIVSPKMELNQTSISRLDLTSTQCRILDLITQGLSNQQIAQELNYTIGTIKQYVSAILLILGVENRVQAVNKFRATRMN